MATDFRGAALGVIIEECRQQKQLEQAELLDQVSDDDEDTIEEDNEQIIIKN